MEDFATVLECTVGLHGCRLPPPVAQAHRLRTLALRTIHEWDRRFGHAYRPLRLAVGYLRRVEASGGLEAAIRETAAQEQKDRQREERKQRSRQERWQRCLVEMDRDPTTMDGDLQQMERLLEILVPVDLLGGPVVGKTSSAIVASDQPTVVSKGKEKDPSVPVLFDGIHNRDYRLEISLSDRPPAFEDESNTVLFEQLRELYHVVVGKHLPVVKRWMEAGMRAYQTPTEAAATSQAEGTTNNAPADHQQRMENLTTILQRMRAVKRKCEDMGMSEEDIQRRKQARRNRAEAEQDSDEDEFIDVDMAPLPDDADTSMIGSTPESSKKAASRSFKSGKRKDSYVVHSFSGKADRGIFSSATARFVESVRSSSSSSGSADPELPATNESTEQLPVTATLDPAEESREGT